MEQERPGGKGAAARLVKRHTHVPKMQHKGIFRPPAKDGLINVEP